MPGSDGFVLSAQRAVDLFDLLIHKCCVLGEIEEWGIALKKKKKLALSQLKGSCLLPCKYNSSLLAGLGIWV